MLFNVLKQSIIRGRTDGLEEKIDVFYAAGKLTDEQYAELTAALSEQGQSETGK